MPKTNRFLPSAARAVATPTPPANGLRELFDRRCRAEHITSEQLGARLGKSAEAVRKRKHSGNWDYREIQQWCKALHITDPVEIGEAILYGVR